MVRGKRGTAVTIITRRLARVQPHPAVIRLWNYDRRPMIYDICMIHSPPQRSSNALNLYWPVLKHPLPPFSRTCFSCIRPQSLQTPLSFYSLSRPFHPTLNRLILAIFPSPSPIFNFSFPLHFHHLKISPRRIFMAPVEAFVEILSKPTIGEVIVDMFMFIGPVWISFLLGVMVGWSWKPRWASLGFCNFHLSAPASPSPLFPLPCKTKGFTSTQTFDSFKVQTPSIASCIVDNGSDKDQLLTLHSVENPNCSSSHTKKEDDLAVREEDFDHLSHLVERKDGGLPWKHMMERSTPNMSYQAWMREPETGPPQYCSRTVYEDATPEMLRDFYWDDEFRLKWDDMITHATTLEECPTTGTMIVHWIRKFPFFCSDREYTIGRRIWESGRTYYCVTKGVPCPSIPRRQKPRRVDLYYSSWSIQAVESRKGNGQLTACEVILFHHEDMGIPWEIAKFGVRQGMWGAVKKVERGFRAYQKERASGAPLSRPAFMAQINTKIDPDHLKSLENDEDLPETEVVSSSEKRVGTNIPKLIVFGGAVALACSLDRGLLTKAIIFSVARRFANIGRGAFPRTQL